MIYIFIKAIRFLYIVISFIIIFITISSFFIYKKYATNLPHYQELKSYKFPVVSRVYASDGSLLTEFSKERRIFVPIDIIPNHLIEAFLAAEDDNFYNHQGVDFLAISRAVHSNAISFLKERKLSGSGGSTITQQVVKNLLLSSERKIERKIKEAILALRIERALSKDKILELYLNQIYLGSGAYGVAAAAQNYFDKSIDELDISEVALLATLPKAPSRLNPRQNIKQSKIRRNWVIRRMLKLGYITEYEAKEAIKKPITLKEKTKINLAYAEFFTDHVKKKLINLYGANDVFTNGSMIRTTIDPNLQTIAEKKLQNGIEKYDIAHGYRGPLGKISLEKNILEELKKIKIGKFYKENWKKAVVLKIDHDKAKILLEDETIGKLLLTNLNWRKYISVDLSEKINNLEEILNKGDVILVEKIKNKLLLRQIPEVNGALVAMNPHDGRVIAMMGGYIDKVNQFNRASQAHRQPGSVLKPFAYLAALENSMTPATLILDEQIVLNQGKHHEDYIPSNYSDKFYGTITLRTALERSLNVATIQMARQIGLDKIKEIIERFNINKNVKEIYSIALGSTETNLIKLATAYSMIVNGGKKIDPKFIEKIQDRNGKTIFRRDNRECFMCSNIEYLPSLSDNRKNIIDPQTAYQMTYLLQGAIENGTGRRAKSVRKILGGKTGTTNNSNDSWFIGFSPDLVVGVYIGFDLPKTLGEKATGSSIALPIFSSFMKEALSEIPSTPFRIPENIKFVKIDKITGSYPTNRSLDKNIILEAFKIDDIIRTPEDNQINNINNIY